MRKTKSTEIDDEVILLPTVTKECRCTSSLSPRSVSETVKPSPLGVMTVWGIPQRWVVRYLSRVIVTTTTFRGEKWSGGVYGRITPPFSYPTSKSKKYIGDDCPMSSLSLSSYRRLVFEITGGNRNNQAQESNQWVSPTTSWNNVVNLPFLDLRGQTETVIPTSTPVYKSTSQVNLRSSITDFLNRTIRFGKDSFLVGLTRKPVRSKESFVPIQPKKNRQEQLQRPTGQRSRGLISIYKHFLLWVPWTVVQ